MERDRDDRRDNRRRRYDQRSRSPPQKDRRDDRRRSRSPPRGPPRGPSHRSDRDRDPYRSRGGYHDRDREPSGTPPPSRRSDDRRPPPRQPLDSRSTNTTNGRGGKQDQRQVKDTRMQDGFEDEDSEAEMQRVMGFKGFRSTKNTKVPGNDKNHGVFKAKATEYRQYMNRPGGFNRPLSPSRDKS